MELISVVVPVYNAGDYLERCLDSLAAQTYPNWEVALADAGSTDGSGRACRERAARDGRFRYVALPVNRGPSAARNAGVERAAGALISFVDADDHIEPDLLEKLHRSLTDSGADISACGADGLRLESGAVDCWDNLIGAGPHSTCLERDIASRLNRYANDQDITDVWIWYEPTDGNCYDIYIGYA